MTGHLPTSWGGTKSSNLLRTGDTWPSVWTPRNARGNAMTAPFDFAPLLAPGTPAPAIKWNGFPKYNFIGGHNHGKHGAGRPPIAAGSSEPPREAAPHARHALQ